MIVTCLCDRSNAAEMSHRRFRRGFCRPSTSLRVASCWGDIPLHTQRRNISALVGSYAEYLLGWSPALVRTPYQNTGARVRLNLAYQCTSVVHRDCQQPQRAVPVALQRNQDQQNQRQCLGGKIFWIYCDISSNIPMSRTWFLERNFIFFWTYNRPMSLIDPNHYFFEAMFTSKSFESRLASVKNALEAPTRKPPVPKDRLPKIHPKIPKK